MNFLKKIYNKIFKGTEFHTLDYDILFLPLNGIFIDRVFTYENLSIYPLDVFKTVAFKNGQFNKIYEHSSIEHPVLKEYNIACYGKDDGSCTNEFFIIEAAGDERLLMNPVLTLKFFNTQERLYPKIANIAHTIYAVIRWLQYKIAGEGLNFDFNFLPLRSSAFSFLDGTEHKVLMPGRFAFLSTECRFLEDNQLSYFYKILNVSINSIINTQETKLNQLLYFYNEIWELILKDDYYLLIVKTLGFLSNYYNTKKFSQLPYIISNIELGNFDKETSAKLIRILDQERKNFLHENKFIARKNLRYSIKSCKDIFGEHLIEIKFILELFDSIIYKELSNADD